MNKPYSPPKFPGYHCVGWIKDAHGIRGELYLQLYAKKADWLDQLEAIQLLEPGQKALTAYAIEAARPHKEGLILKVKGVVDRNHAEKIRKSGAYIPEELLRAEPGGRIYLGEVLGFTLLDKDGNPLGQIVGLATNGAQDLLQIQRLKGGEALIPFVDDFLVHIDFDKKSVKMDLPQGLLDLEEE